MNPQVVLAIFEGFRFLLQAYAREQMTEAQVMAEMERIGGSLKGHGAEWRELRGGGD